jgi:hypothetical protein
MAQAALARTNRSLTEPIRSVGGWAWSMNGGRSDQHFPRFRYADYCIPREAAIQGVLYCTFRIKAAQVQLLWLVYTVCR